MNKENPKTTDEISLMKMKSCLYPTNLAFLKKLQRGGFIRNGNEDKGGFLPDWVKLLLLTVATIIIIATAVGVGALLFISPMTALVVVAIIIACLVMSAAIADN